MRRIIIVLVKLLTTTGDYQSKCIFFLLFSRNIKNRAVAILKITVLSVLQYYNHLVRGDYSNLKVGCNLGPISARTSL